MASTASASRAAAARPTVQLHVRQAQAHDALASAFLRGVRRAMVVLPTGVGKTVTALAAPRALRLARAGTVRRMLFIAHRKPLLRQAMKTAAWVEPGPSAIS